MGQNGKNNTESGTPTKRIRLVPKKQTHQTRHLQIQRRRGINKTLNSNEKSKADKTRKQKKQHIAKKQNQNTDSDVIKITRLTISEEGKPEIEEIPHKLQAYDHRQASTKILTKPNNQQEYRSNTGIYHINQQTHDKYDLEIHENNQVIRGGCETLEDEW